MIFFDLYIKEYEIFINNINVMSGISYQCCSNDVNLFLFIGIN
jgi:hypothetical protein